MGLKTIDGIFVGFLVIGTIVILGSSLDYHSSRPRYGTRTRAQYEVNCLTSALSAFYADTGRLPTNAEGLDVLIHKPAHVAAWQGPYVNRGIVDPWGRHYVYRARPGKRMAGLK